MTTASRSGIFSTIILGTIFTGGIAIAEDVDPVREVLNDVPTDVRVFNEHVTVLASPWMGGRLPGTPGMEMAKDYTEYWFKAGGLEPAVIDSTTGEGSFRHPLPLGSSTEFKDQKLVMNTDDGSMTFDITNPESSEGFRIFLIQTIISYIGSWPLTGSGFMGIWILFEDRVGSAHGQFNDVLFRTGIIGLFVLPQLI